MESSRFRPRSLLALVAALALLTGSVVATRGTTSGDYRPNEVCVTAGDLELCAPEDPAR